MLLICCFRDPQTKKGHIKGSINSRDEETPTYKNSPSSPLLRNKGHETTAYRKAKEKYLERYPTSRGKKRLSKQKSLESFHSKSSLSEDNSTQRGFNSTEKNIVTGSFTSLSRIGQRVELSPIPPTTATITPECYSNCGDTSTATQSSIESASKLYESPPAKIFQHFDPLKTSTPSSVCMNIPSPSKDFLAGKDVPDTKNYIESSDQPTAPTLQKPNEHEKKIVDMRNKHNLKTLQVIDENALHLEKVKRDVDARFEEQISSHQIENVLKIEACKKESEQMIAQLRNQYSAEIEKLLRDQEEHSRNLEEEAFLKEKRLKDLCDQAEIRDKAWREEKEEIIKEVRTLKSEAGQMVSLLAAEYQEENESEDRKISLSQEVYSLQLVVEMRNSEVKSLREQLAKLTHQMEQVQLVKQELAKANARVEDLEEQLRIKTVEERRLSQEKCQLEKNVAEANKAFERISQNMEELQWKVRNNFEAPVTFKKPTLCFKEKQSLAVIGSEM